MHEWYILTDVMSKQFNVIIVAVKMSEVFCIQPEHNQLNGAVLHAEIHQLQTQSAHTYVPTKYD